MSPIWAAMHNDVRVYFHGRLPPSLRVRGKTE